ncbi:MAG: iron ABC transporter permease [Acidimicrobiia bacterium]
MTRSDARTAGRDVPRGAIAAGIGIAVVAVIAGVLGGPVALPIGGTLLELVDLVPFVDVESGLTDTQATILLELRLPRVVLGLAVGGMLGLAGGSYQGVFRNPLADPYLLGIAAGAGLGATLGFVAGGSATLVPLAAFVGAIVAVTASAAIAGSIRGGSRGPTLILAGVAMASFLTAIQTWLLQQNAETLRQVYAWILGRLTTVGWGEVVLLVPYAALAAVVLLPHGRLLDVLGFGDDEARSLGVDVTRVRWVVLSAASLATAAAVAVSGLIGFVGIVVPHLVRLLVGSSYRAILPLSLLGGGAFLVAADLLARIVTAPSEVPIGVITAFVGAPFFLLVLYRQGTDGAW